MNSCGSWEQSFQLGTSVESVRRTAQGQWAVRRAESPELVFDRLIVALPASRRSRRLAAGERLTGPRTGSDRMCGGRGRVVRFPPPPNRTPARCLWSGRSRHRTTEYRRHQLRQQQISRPRTRGSRFAARLLGRCPQRRFARTEQPIPDTNRPGRSHVAARHSRSTRIESHRRWNSVTPQYHVGHVSRIDRLEAYGRALPNFALAGNAYHGIGIPQCIQSGRDAAQQVHAIDLI